MTYTQTPVETFRLRHEILESCLYAAIARKDYAGAELLRPQVERAERALVAAYSRQYDDQPVRRVA